MNRVLRNQPKTQLSDMLVIINSAKMQHLLQEWFYETSPASVSLSSLSQIGNTPISEKDVSWQAGQSRRVTSSATGKEGCLLLSHQVWYLWSTPTYLPRPQWLLVI